MLAAAAMTSSLPQLPERYTIVETVTDSAVERTFRAVDKVLHREVLLKLPGSVFAGWSVPVQERSLREARALARIRHPAVPAIYSVEQTAEGPLLVMDVPAGESLGERLQRGTLDVETVRTIGVQVATALTQVHLCNVVHRAVGARSIRLLADGGVQLGSFTFAKEMTGPGAGSSLGGHGRKDSVIAAGDLPDYLAPEQRIGQPADARADIYALGCTLFRCLTGVEAYEPGDERLPMPDLRRLRPDVPPEFAEIIRRCLLPVRTARYSTAQEVADALRAVSLAPPKAARFPAMSLVLAGLAAAVMFVGIQIAQAMSRGGAAGGGGTGEEGGTTSAPSAPSLSGHYDQVYGLFVGIGRAYRDPRFEPLATAEADVRAVIDRLQANDSQWRRPGAVQPLLEADATSEKILGGIRTIVAKAGENDAVLFYFAGHGVREGTAFGLAAANASGSVFDGGGFIKRDMLELLFGCRAKHVLVILDCCDAGAMMEPQFASLDQRSLPPSADDEGSWLCRYRVREMVTSTGRGPASDGQGHSPFCQKLLDELAPQRFDHGPIAANTLLPLARGSAAGGREPSQWGQRRSWGNDRGKEPSFVFRYAPN